MPVLPYAHLRRHFGMGLSTAGDLDSSGSSQEADGLTLNHDTYRRSIGLHHQTTIEVYIYLWNYYQEHGFSPTQQEIAEACYLARSGISRHLDKLTIWGWVSREDGKARGVRPLKPLNEIENQLPLPKF